MTNADKTEKKEHAAIDPMAQVRELLFGEAERKAQQTIDGLEAKLNQAQAQIEARFAKIEATAQQDRMEARERDAAAIRRIGEMIERVGREIIGAADSSGSK